MSKRKFTEEEIKLLKENKFVKKVSEKGITYTEECRREYTNLISTGMSKKEAFRKLGFDPELLGYNRINSFYKRMKTNLKNNKTFEDKRNNNGSRRKEVNFEEMSSEEKIEYLRHENLMLKAENELLKKMEFLAKRQELKESQLRTDIN